MCNARACQECLLKSGMDCDGCLDWTCEDCFVDGAVCQNDDCYASFCQTAVKRIWMFAVVVRKRFARENPSCQRVCVRWITIVLDLATVELI